MTESSDYKTGASSYIIRTFGCITGTCSYSLVQRERNLETGGEEVLSLQKMSFLLIVNDQLVCIKGEDVLSTNAVKYEDCLLQSQQSAAI